MQQLVATITSQTYFFTIFAIGEKQNAIASSADSVNSKVQVLNVSAVALVQIRDDQYKARFSVTRELGNEIPILSNKKYSF